MQETLQQFAESVPVGVSGISLQTFADGYLDSLLTYGNAVGELLLEESSGTISGLLLARPDWVQIAPGKRPGLPCFPCGRPDRRNRFRCRTRNASALRH